MFQPVLPETGGLAVARRIRGIRRLGEGALFSLETYLFGVTKAF